jgi:hypothetical protein
MRVPDECDASRIYVVSGHQQVYPSTQIYHGLDLNVPIIVLDLRIEISPPARGSRSWCVDQQRYCAWTRPREQNGFHQEFVPFL